MAQPLTSYRTNPVEDMRLLRAIEEGVSSHLKYAATLKVNGKVVSKNKGATTINTKGAEDMVPIKAYFDQPATSVDNTNSGCAADRSPANSSSLRLWFDISSTGGAGCRDAFSTIGSGNIDITIHLLKAMSTDKTTATEIGATTYKNCTVYDSQLMGTIGITTLLYDGFDGSLTMFGTKGNKLGKAAFGDKGSNPNGK